jgi:hypothetical protein
MPCDGSILRLTMCVIAASRARAFLWCKRCVPPWEINYIPIDRPPWNAVNAGKGERFQCPGCGGRVAWHMHRKAWKPTYSYGEEAAAPTAGSLVGAERSRDDRPWLGKPSSPDLWDRPDNLPRRLVLSLALIRDRPQKSALCPRQVCHFHDHRPHPMDAREFERRAKAGLPGGGASNRPEWEATGDKSPTLLSMTLRTPHREEQES